jgi:putative membrane protein
MMGNDGYFFHGGGFMWVFWILIIVGIFFLVQNMMRGNSEQSSTNKESPLEILKKRYARGEIEEEEYERRRKELES